MLRGVVLLGLFIASVTAHAEAARYLGPHPLDLDGNWHLVEGVHEHGALPVGLEPFGVAGGIHVFLGDPIAYGYTQTVFGYVGGHPLPTPALGYCGLGGVHRHPFVPEGSYQRDGSGNYVYRGAFRGGRARVVPRRTVPPRPVVAGTPTIPFPTPYGYFPGMGYWGGPWAFPALGGGGPVRPAPAPSDPPAPPAVAPPPPPAPEPDARIRRLMPPSAGGGR
ncbi:MAG: hypothetical protein U0230_19055 [Polyangiales bacterium]